MPGSPKVRTLSRKQKLTPEQEKIRLRGLRLLARMIGPRPPGVQGEGGVLAGDCDGEGPVALDGDNSLEDGENVR